MANTALQRAGGPGNQGRAQINVWFRTKDLHNLEGRVERLRDAHPFWSADKLGEELGIPPSWLGRDSHNLRQGLWDHRNTFHETTTASFDTPESSTAERSNLGKRRRARHESEDENNVMAMDTSQTIHRRDFGSLWRQRSMKLSEVLDGGYCFLDDVDNFDVHRLPKLANLDRIKNIERFLSLRRRVDPWLPRPPVPFLQGFFEIQPARRFQPIDDAASTWSVTALQVQNLAHDDKLSDCTAIVVFEIHSTTVNAVGRARLLQLLCTALDRIPLNLSRGAVSRDYGIGLARDFALAVAQADQPLDRPLNVRDPVELDAFSYYCRKRGSSIGTPYLWFWPRYFTRNAFVGQQRLRISPHTLVVGRDPPTIPPYFRPAPRPTWHEQLTDIQKRQHNLAASLVEYMLAETMHCIATGAEIEAHWGSFISGFQAHVSGQSRCSGPYEGKNALRLVPVWPDYFKIFLGAKVLADIKCEKPRAHGEETDDVIHPIRIHSIASCRREPVLTLFYQEWLNSSSPIAAYREAAAVADQINRAIQDGEPELSGCSCLPLQGRSGCHHCGLCGVLTPCEALEEDVTRHLRVCYACAPRDQRRLGAASRATVQQLLKRSVSKDLGIYKPSGHYVRPTAEQKRELDMRLGQLAHHLEKQLGISDYGAIPDAYCPGVIRTHVQTHGKPCPFAPSPDAVLPFFRGPSGYAYLHYPGNIGFTARYLNFACNRYPKGVLQIVVAWIKGTLSVPHLARLLANVTAVARETPWAVSQRLDKWISLSDWEHRKQSWRKIEPMHSQPDGAPDREMPGVNSSQLHLHWQPQNVNRTICVISEILQGAEVQPVRGKDGCVYPFDGRFMPRNWCYFAAYKYFGGLLSTLYRLAGSLWPIEDDIETLYLEAIFQCAHPGENKLRLLPELPILTWETNPLRVSLGHRKPGMALITGWKHQPRSLHDRVGIHTNLSYETAFENFAKSNFPPAYYPLMRVDLLGVRLDDAVFDHTILSPSYLEGTGNRNETISPTYDDSNGGWSVRACAEMLHEDMQGWEGEVWTNDLDEEHGRSEE